MRPGSVQLSKAHGNNRLIYSIGSLGCYTPVITHHHFTKEGTAALQSRLADYGLMVLCKSAGPGRFVARFGQGIASHHILSVSSN